MGGGIAGSNLQHICYYIVYLRQVLTTIDL